jgi:hypothetical protein
MSIHADLKRQLKDVTTMLYPSDEPSPWALEEIAKEAIDEIERLNSEASMKENAFLAEKVFLLSEIKRLHEKVALLQEQKAGLNASLEHYDRYER